MWPRPPVRTANAGCADVRTVLATGNVVFSDRRANSELRTVLEAAYSQRLAYEAVVQVLTLDAVEAHPFETLDEHHD